MNLQVLLPSQVFASERGVSRIVVETAGGSFGLLPRRLDCVAALVPGILSYDTPEAGEVFIAVDSGVLVKTGRDVRVSVRRALRGTGLAQLRSAVEQQFLVEDAESRRLQAVMSKLEAGFASRFSRMQHDRHD